MVVLVTGLSSQDQNHFFLLSSGNLENRFNFVFCFLLCRFYLLFLLHLFHLVKCPWVSRNALLNKMYYYCCYWNKYLLCFFLVIVNWTQPSLTAQQEPFTFKPVVSVVSKTYIHFHRRQTALFALLRHWSVSHGALFNHTSQLLAVFASTSHESGQTDILKGARCFCSLFPSLTQSLTTHCYKNEQQYSSKQSLRGWI